MIRGTFLCFLIDTMEINNADEDVDCVTSATESSIYHNDSFLYICVNYEEEIRI